MVYEAGPRVASLRVMTPMLANADPCGGTFDRFFQILRQQDRNEHSRIQSSGLGAPYSVIQVWLLLVCYHLPCILPAHGPAKQISLNQIGL